MRLGRVASPDGVAFVAIDGDPSVSNGDGADVTVRQIAEHPFGNPTFTGRTWKLADVRLLAPILSSKVVCIGKNYAAHAAEMGGEAPAEPVIFMKPSTSIIGPEIPIQLPDASEEVHYEGELAVVIGRPCKDVPAARARDVILGYTVANDVTARDLQRRDGQWTRAKGFDTFCPLGPWINTDIDPSDLRIHTELDGQTVQDSRTSLLLHDIPTLIEWVSRVMTLLPGDVILTGTPEGVGPIRAGQKVSVTIDGIGTLTNTAQRRSS
ncbi:fumarylacetoacetate hydrolase family protein [Hoyosella rhizosphaerae]|uniref:2-hydroxyhepta-2,4-diene-1,7-dioate isomerase n=1 Tax=Hoyosella rhizosphaerae TaxID=1755582 RepID=A0A916TY68_9ACTN|nr:fumarylacetoacetate hydrolase family protein [Hoyosella rhizosphaerae]MBN4927335.1 fumarylacetoacetate hydrolase family protein [Hoyosella rhizosphaerae]GGC52069.1 2-hydroxyhepta-2,4-diene-1,7-dioate isomerase [Hoyosella rhizosphaerae]